MLSIAGNPSFLREFAIVGFSSEQVLGEAGALEITLHPTRPGSDPYLTIRASLKEVIGEKLDCSVGSWRFVGTVEGLRSSADERSYILLLRDSFAALDKLHASQVFAEQTLGDVLAGLMPNDSNYECIAGFDSTPVRLAIQFQESHLQFLKRLVNRLGGEMWCDGDTIYVGDRPRDDATSLRLGHEVTDCSYRVLLGPESIEVESIAHLDKNKSSLSTHELPQEQHGALQSSVVELRRKHESAKLLHIVHDDAGYEDSTHLARSFLRSRAFGRLELAGTSRSPIPLGTRLRIEEARQDGQGVVEETTLVRALRGYASPTGGKARWAFEGTNPEGLMAAPSWTLNRVFMSSGVVEESNDPLNRVRVIFPWDKNQCPTPWLRVTSPSWGEGHGHYIPPRKGDTVLVVWGQAAMDPIVLGSVSAGQPTESSDDSMAVTTVEGQALRIDKNRIVLSNQANGGDSILELHPDEIAIKTVNGQGIAIGSDRITIDSGDGCTLEMRSGKIVVSGGKIEIANGQGASVELEGSRVSINGGALEIS